MFKIILHCAISGINIGVGLL